MNTDKADALAAAKTMVAELQTMLSNVDCEHISRMLDEAQREVDFEASLLQ